MACAGPRSEITIDREALRANLRRLRAVLGRSELWAVVKADAYGHGASTVAEIALAEGAAALCVATVAEGLELRAFQPEARIIVLSPTVESELRAARSGALELTVVEGPLPEGLPLHVKVDTGMGRWGGRSSSPAARMSSRSPATSPRPTATRASPSSRSRASARSPTSIPA